MCRRKAVCIVTHASESLKVLAFSARLNAICTAARQGVNMSETKFVRIHELQGHVEIPFMNGSWYNVHVASITAVRPCFQR